MARFFLDTEFVDDSERIKLISFGLVREDRKAWYWINGDDSIIDEAVWHHWLNPNVTRHLPVRIHRYGDPDGMTGMSKRNKLTGWDWDDGNPEIVCVKPKKLISLQVQRVLSTEGDGAPELWAWYSAYDHVAFAQLFGTMVQLPHGFPMLTRDLKDWALRLGDPQVPQHTGREHHALDDAAHDLDIYEFLREREAETPR
jgi:hypothetical protein